MQYRKLFVPLLAVLLVGIITPALPTSLPKAHADDQSVSVSISGFLARDYYDTYLGCCEDVIASGNTLTFNVVFTSNTVAFQRNLTLGVKFDWMNNFVNSTTVSVYASQTTTVTLQYTIPALTGQYTNLNQVTHTWTLELWDMSPGATWSANNYCYDYNYNFPTATCHQWNSYSYPYHPVGVYNSEQASCYSSKLQAGAIITALASIFSTTGSQAPGTSGAIAMLAKADTEYQLANSAYNSGDFATAQTQYQNSLNDANAAQQNLQTVGGGTDTSTLTSIWIDSVAILFGGIGALLVGFAGFKFLRGKTRAIGGYTPSASPK